MASPLEALPNEILDSILEYLINHDIGGLRDCDHLDCMSLARLSQCSHFLNRRLEPLLYGTSDARNGALRNACMTGNLHAIRKATSYGANPGVFWRYLSNNTVLHAGQDMGYPESSSLQVALNAGQLEAFNLLLDLGAGVTPHEYSDEEVLDLQLNRFAQRLAQVESVAFLKAFVEARAETPYWQDDRKENYSQAQAVLRRLPLPGVVLWASPALLETLLDNGAPLNQAFLSWFRVKPVKRRPMTPLGAACLRGDADVFQLLVARGAQFNVDDSLRSKYPNEYTQIPIFVAAHYMASTGNPSMLDACIAGGADVNLPCHFHPSPEGYIPPESPNTTHRCTTPFLTYLRSIKSWDTAASDSGKPYLTPAEGVAHFIHALGANASSPVVPPSKRKDSCYTHELYDRTFETFPYPPIKLLLVKWGIESLAIPEFWSVIKLLVEHGTAGPDLVRIMVRLDGQNKSSSDNNVVDVEGLWQQFLALLKPQLESLDQAAKDALLRRVIVDKAEMRSRDVYPPPVWVKVRAVGRASISALVRAGADINHVARETVQHPTMNTPLHQIVSSFAYSDCQHHSYLHDHSKGHNCPYTRDLVESFGEFLAYLVSEGADPLVEDTRFQYRKDDDEDADERTAIDTLLSPMKTGRIPYGGGTFEQGLMHFVARLQGTSPVTSYTGYRKRDYYAMKPWPRNPSYTRAECKARIAALDSGDASR